MKPLNIDFSNVNNKHKKQFVIFCFLIVISLLFFVLVEHGRIKTEIANVEQRMASSQGFNIVRQAQPTEEDRKLLAQAKVIQGKLNFPWQILLTALEEVKQQSAAISLMTIQPKPVKNEVVLTGEVNNLAALLAFVSSLEDQTVFHQVFLVNQRRLNENKNNLAFTIKMGWKV